MCWPLALRQPAKLDPIRGFWLEFPLTIRNLPAALRSLHCSLTRSMSLYSLALTHRYWSLQSCLVTPQLLCCEEEIFVGNMLLLPLPIARLPDNSFKHSAFSHLAAETRCSIFCSFDLTKSEGVYGVLRGAGPLVEGRKRHRNQIPTFCLLFQIGHSKSEATEQIHTPPVTFHPFIRCFCFSRVHLGSPLHQKDRVSSEDRSKDALVKPHLNCQDRDFYKLVFSGWKHAPYKNKSIIVYLSPWQQESPPQNKQLKYLIHYL